LDLVLPDGNGTDVCRELRTWTTVPVIVLSAVGDESEKVAALDAGADDYVTKPFGIDELLARLRAALRRADPVTEPPVACGAGRRGRRRAHRPRKARGDQPRRACPADTARVRPARPPRPQPGQAADSRRHPPRGVGSPVRPRVPLPARLCVTAPPQDRARPDT